MKLCASVRAMRYACSLLFFGQATGAQVRGTSRLHVEAAQLRTGSATPCSASEIEEFVAAHNMYRCMHGAGNVVWSDAVAENAHGFIKDMTDLQHSDSYGLAPPAGPAAENLFWSSQAGAAPADIVRSWYSE